ncbi:hypothetical protein D3C72_1552330 [compost metagenome]
MQRVVQFSQHVGGGHVDAGDRFCGDHQPAHGRGRCRDGVEHAVAEQFGVGEKQGGIPAKQDQAGDQACVGVAFDVVVALDPIGAAQYRGVRAPAVPEEFNDGNHDGQADALDGAEHGHADGTDNRQPAFPALDAIDPAQVGDFDQANGRGDHDCRQGAGR